MKGLNRLSELERHITQDAAMTAALAGCNKASFRMLRFYKPPFSKLPSLDELRHRSPWAPCIKFKWTVHFLFNLNTFGLISCGFPLI